MFWRILKKDLKRKKTMNMILLLFVILCSMLAAASVNNIIAVTGGIEHFMEISDAPDVKIIMPFGQELDKKLSALPGVNAVRVEEMFYLTPEHFRLNGEKHKELINGTGFISDKEFGCKYFDDDDREIGSVPVGSVSSTDIAFDAVEIFAVCPAILIGVTVIGTFMTALYTKTIKASDTASIE